MIKAQRPERDERVGRYLYVNNFAHSVDISESSSSNTPGRSLVYSLPPRTSGLNLTNEFQ